VALLPVSALAETGEADGFRLTPEISWSQGDHWLALHFNSRIRYEQPVEQGWVLAAIMGGL
jgi:hypothetical protein